MSFPSPIVEPATTNAHSAWSCTTSRAIARPWGLARWLGTAGLLSIASPVLADPGRVEQSAEGIAAELANPLSPITTLSAQYRVEAGWGPGDETNHLVRLQPSLYKPMEGDAAFLLRTIAPLRVVDFPASASGVGDVSLITYYVPDTTSRVFVGYGGALVLPTATDDVLGSGKWSAGPALIVAVPGDPLTWGALVQHLWSVGGESDRADVDVTTLQPFATWLLGGGWSATMNAESTRNWEGPSSQAWTVPIALAISRVVKVGHRYVSVGLGYVDYLEAPEFAADYEVRLSATYVIR